MNGDRPSSQPVGASGGAPETDPLQAEVEALRAEVLRLRRQERRHLQELAQFARMAEGKRLGIPQIRTFFGRLRSRAVAFAKRLRRAIVARLPGRLKATLRRLQTRYLP
ncbi:nucleotide exchange factor GrpE [Paracoccus xiamenensis]|uniref:hypothetical protein n=1 Tax=Paracoccus xiamenensis TaxID=2714901 RepID=UPI00140DCA16|nr:hypothetical protein [Paracoccus xiamenensis]NHF74023.1 hypothetical protein [Paracoccus xiamenensis]